MSSERSSFESAVEYLESLSKVDEIIDDLFLIYQLADDKPTLMKKEKKHGGIGFKTWTIYHMCRHDWIFRVETNIYGKKYNVDISDEILGDIRYQYCTERSVSYGYSTVYTDSLEELREIISKIDIDLIDRGIQKLKSRIESK